MRIDHIEAVNLLYDYPDRHGFEYAAGICTSRVTTLVLVHTDTGEVGIGSVYTHPVLAYLIIRDQLDPMLRGRDPADIEDLWDLMYGLTRWYGRKGAAMSAIGGVDTALWDLRGKAAGQPIWKLLGGERDTCPAYASSMFWQEVDDLAAEAARHVADGFRRVKMRLARSEEYDVAAVRAVRETIGPRNDLMVDGSMRYSPTVALRMGRVFEEHKVFWYEEPFAPEDIDAYADLHGKVDVAIAAGENEFGFQGFRELIRATAVDIVQPDACRCGGISEVRRVAGLAHDHGLRVATHTWSDAVAVVANAHVVSAAPNGITVEIDRTGTPFIEELLLGTLDVKDGLLQLGDRPGLGIELNPEVVDAYRMADPLRIPDGSYSDMMFGKAYLPRQLPFVECEP